MKLEEYLKYRIEKAGIDLDLIIKIQNLELLKYVAKQEKLNHKDLCKKYIEPHTPLKEREKINTQLEYKPLLNFLFSPYFKSDRNRQDVIKRYLDNINNNEYKFIKIMLDYLLVFKNETINNNNMEVSQEDKFNLVFQTLFANKITNKNCLKVKKCRLKKKILNNDIVSKENDYEYIMFKHIMDIS